VIFTETALKGTILIAPEPVPDERGFFARVWCEREFARHGIEARWVQSSISFNRRRGTLRGLHYQEPPHEEDKLVRCTMGAIFDVVVDLRRDSPSFREHLTVVLSSANRLMLFIPKGCAHGFQTLEDDTEVSYHMSEFYAPGQAAGVRWDDPAFGIPWPIRDPIVSERDRRLPGFSERSP
jgi:dTDP-4-dehydrorhamnose 3,5-epimerase